MKHQIVAVYDRATMAYGRPVFVPALGGAIRSFSDEVNRPQQPNDVSNHPDDFELYHLGEYDDADASIQTFTPVRLARASDLKETAK